MLKNTRLGSFVKSMATASVLDIETAAYNENVLVQMADLNKDQLNEEGLFVDGSDTPEYTPYTKKLKAEKGQPYEHMTFRDTGETQDSITYKFNGNLVADWTDFHNLEENYKQIVGLASESMDFIKPEISENIRDHIKSKL